MPPASTPISPTRTGPLPLEFLLLRHHELEPWSPADSLVWLRLMALDLSVNYRDELLRARLARQLSDEQIADVWPDYPEGAPVTLVELARALPAEQLAAALPPARRARAGLERLGRWPAAAPRAGRRCSPTIRISACRRRASGTSPSIKAPELELVGATHAGRAGHRARPQRQPRLGAHQHRRRHPGPVRRADRSGGSRRATSRPTARRRSRSARR